MSTIESPCVDICQLNPNTGICTGWFRTMDEISLWIELSDDEKQEVLRLAKERGLKIFSDNC